MHDLALGLLGGLFGFFNLQSLQFYSISVLEILVFYWLKMGTVRLIFLIFVVNREFIICF